MNLFRKLTVKPWMHEGLDNDASAAVMDLVPARTGLRMFLAVITSLFSLFGIAYFMRMKLPDWQALAEPNLLWFNTVALAVASVSMQFARNAAKQGKVNSVRAGLTAGGLLSVLFLIGQLAVWRQLIDAGFFAISNPAYAFFYLLTGLHGLHLAGGLWVWGRTMIRVWRGLDDNEISAVAEARQSIELCTTYWHYLFFVWLAMFALLLST